MFFYYINKFTLFNNDKYLYFRFMSDQSVYGIALKPHIIHGNNYVSKLFYQKIKQ